MKSYNINIDTKYFEPIRTGQIRLLIFDKKCIDYVDGESAEIIAQKGEYSVKANIVKTYIKSFAEITEEEAFSAGFLNKEFLADELQRRFQMDTLDVLLNRMDSYLFYLIKISPKYKEDNLFFNNSVGGDYSDTF